MLNKIKMLWNQSPAAGVMLVGILFFAIVWIYPVPMKNIVLWMDTSESREAYVVAQLQWDDGTGYTTGNMYENAIVSSEVFIRIPKSAKKNAERYRLTLQNEDGDVTVSDIKLNGDHISLEDFAEYIDSADGVEIEQTSEALVLHTTEENPSITLTADFTGLVKRKWHMANVTRLWLSIAGVIGTLWGLIYVKMEDQ